MGGKKVLFLFLVLALPTCVFVFLKIFGSNEFDVPLLYDKGVAVKPEECNVTYNQPYIVADTIIQKMSAEEAFLRIINFADASARLEEIRKEFVADDVVLLHHSAISNAYQDSNFLQRCVFLTTAPNTIVLIDKERRIRGHYNGADRDELDRLQAEIKIILKKY
jgi:hypothetical protein